MPVELLTADQSTFWGKLPIWAAGLQPTPQGHKSQLVEAAGLDLRDQHLIDRTLISLGALLIQSEPKTRLSRQTEALKRCASESATDIRIDD